MEKTNPWQDPDYREPELPEFKFVRTAALVSVILVLVPLFILFFLQLSYIGATGAPIMSWWWVVSPILFMGGLWFIAFCIIVGVLFSAIVSDIRHS